MVSLIYYLAAVFLLLSGLFWLLVSISTSIDFTIVGHKKGWKRIRYAHIFGSFIDSNRFGAKVIKDDYTHPQVIILLMADLVMLAIVICGSILLFGLINDFNLWVLVVIEITYYVLLLCRMILFRVLAKKAMVLKQQENHN